MDLTLNDEQRLLQDSADRYVAQRYGYSVRNEIAASVEGFSRAVWQDFASFGWLALPLPVAHGGLGGDAVDLGLLMTAFGRGLVMEPYLPALLGGGLIAAVGTAAQQADWLPAVAEGRCLLAFAHAEPGNRHRMHQVDTRALRSPGGWVLRGRKHLVLGGASADALVVSARIAGASGDAQGLGLFTVRGDAPGLSRQPVVLVDGRRACQLELDAVHVNAAAWLGGLDDALPQIDAALDRARAAALAEAHGCMRALLDATLTYTKTRVQFGQALAANQVLRHRMVDMAVQCEEAQSMALLAALKADAPADERSLAVSSAMNKVMRGARFVAEQAVQLHGAMGVTEEVAVGAWLKRLMAFELMLGGSSYHLDRHARLRGWRSMA